MIGFISVRHAKEAAAKLGMAGLTGSGQECGVYDLPDGSYLYWTAHNYFQPEEDPGCVLLPGSEVYDLSSAKDCAALEKRAGCELWHTVLGWSPPSEQEEIERLWSEFAQSLDDRL